MPRTLCCWFMCLAVDCVDPHDIIFHNNMPADATEWLSIHSGFLVPQPPRWHLVSRCDNNFIRSPHIRRLIGETHRPLKLRVYDRRCSERSPSWTLCEFKPCKKESGITRFRLLPQTTHSLVKFNSQSIIYFDSIRLNRLLRDLRGRPALIGTRLDTKKIILSLCITSSSRFNLFSKSTQKTFDRSTIWFALIKPK